MNDWEYADMERKHHLKKNLKRWTEERLLVFNENKRKKAETLKQENKRKEMEECTFAPWINDHSYRWNLEEFLDDQRKHEEEKEVRRNMRMQDESALEGREIHRPQLCPGSEKLLENRANVPIHERLYDISKEWMEKGIRQMWDSPGMEDHKDSPNWNSEETFKPKILKKSQHLPREKPVDQLLYEDAQKRKGAHKKRVIEVMDELKSQKEHKTSHNNIEYLVHKFNREFEPIYESIASVDSDEGEQEEAQKLNYRQLSELLYSMGYLSGSQSSEAEEWSLLSAMWSSLDGEENEGIDKEVIRAFLIAVEGVKITDGVKTSGAEEFGETKDGDFYPDCAKISWYFKLFYLNRIRYIGLWEQPWTEGAKVNAEEDCTFKPKISSATEEYAQKYRQRIADAYDGGKITVLDILTATTNKEQWIEETKKELEANEDKNCTFKPWTNNYVSNRAADDESHQIITPSTGDKCEDLYQLSIIKKKNKMDKTTDEVEFEKGQDELTFQPNLNKKNPWTAKKKYKVNQRSVQDNIERMRWAREEWERKRMMTERGYQSGKS